MVRKLVFILAAALLLQINFVDALKCYTCDSSINKDCIDDLSKVEPTECKKGETFCMTSVDATTGVVERKCSTTECTNDHCKTSGNENGNNHNICQMCSSSTDPKCAQSVGAVFTFNKVCEKADTKCLINIKDKNTERDCASADEETNCAKNEDTCKVCTGGNCNIGIFPKNRLSCYQCSGDTCKQVGGTNEDAKSLPCVNYDANDKCYTFSTGPKADMSRGCVSDSSDKDNKCSTPDSNELCATCNTANCNDRTYLRDSSLKCFQCTSSSSDSSCMWSMNGNEAKNCQKQIEYYKTEMCYTQVKDGVVHRGCLYDREDSLGKCEENCNTCATGGCNSKDAGVFTCIRCRSDLNSDCYNDAEKIEGSDCRNSVTLEDSGCFHGMWNGVVIRGCMVDASEQMQATCKDAKNSQCNFCKDKNCNNAKTTTSGASYLSSFQAFVLISVVLIVQKL